MTMKIIAGSVGGRHIVAGSTIRPTSGKVREAIFNSLASLGAIAESRVVDLFAGSGALGIEALSRGARQATFVERDNAALKLLRQNLTNLNLEQQSKVVRADATTYLPTAHSFDLLLIDPPYSFDGWSLLLAQASKATQAGRVAVVIESDRPIEVPKLWKIHLLRRYGGTVITIAETPPSRPNPNTSRPNINSNTNRPNPNTNSSNPKAEQT